MQEPSYVYIIVRKDLPGQHLLVQACHAAIAATFSYGKHPTPHLVVCAVPNERALESAFNRLKDAGVSCCSYTEPDLNGSLTSIATAPLKGAEQRKPLRRYQLLK